MGFNINNTINNNNINNGKINNKYNMEMNDKEVIIAIMKIINTQKIIFRVLQNINFIISNLLIIDFFEENSKN